MRFEATHTGTISLRRLDLAPLARVGFTDLARARTEVAALALETGQEPEQLLQWFARAADPDVALTLVQDIHRRHPQELSTLSGEQWAALLPLIGASPALGDFFVRNVASMHRVLDAGGRIGDAQDVKRELLAAVGRATEDDGSATTLTTPDDAVFAALAGEEGACALRVRYRELLAGLVLVDLDASSQPDGALAVFERVSAGLTALAEGTLEAALAVARTTLVTTGGAGQPIARSVVAASRLAVIAMGKCGAGELNVVSDVDVIFVGESADEEQVSAEHALRVTTRLAAELMRVIHDPGAEPPLWQMDANLRPEGRSGQLVRTLASHLSYYERWAKTWEFQALLKARAVAGDAALGSAYVERTRPLVWASSSREDFVGSVQRMRERVTEHIADDELDIQLKLGPGGLRDVEFSVQLLQLVHGQQDASLRVRGTLEGLTALVDGGYVARADGERLSEAYRVLRVFEHRLQLRDLRRTALMPRDDEELRVLARASGLAPDASTLRGRWEAVKRDVRDLHVKIFYAPLLSAVAELPGDELHLGSDGARARLRTIGFTDPDGALRHMTALMQGTSRRAMIQRNLMPVLLHWFAQGTDPDYGLLAFRRISESVTEASWYLRLLRDGTDAAWRLTQVLSSSRFAGKLLERSPEAVAWLEDDDELVPVTEEKIRGEMRAILSRQADGDVAARRMRAVHRRAVMRIALGALVGVGDARTASDGLDAAHTALLDGLLAVARRTVQPNPQSEFALIAMGRYGGRELGFASDADLIAVYRDDTAEGREAAARDAARTVAELRRLTEDPFFSIELDFDLRPEGKSGALARSLDSYRAYYARWSLTWEAQALLRARFVVGDEALGRDFEVLADAVRYPVSFGDEQLREVRRMKARVEAERLPRGADPKRHLKLGPGAISDVEWLVQLLQLAHGHAQPELRTVSTVEALHAAVGIGLIDAEDADHLLAPWTLAGEIRSANMLWSGSRSDSLPSDRGELEGIARILGLPPGHTTELEERWFQATRRSRAVFEREFFGY